MRLLRIVVWTAMAVFFLAIGSPWARAEASTVTVVVRGGKGSGAKDLAASLIGALEAKGMKVIADRVLTKKSKELDEELARAAGSELLATVHVKKVKKRYVADAKLVQVKTGKTLKSVKKKYKKATSASAIGSAIGKDFSGGSGAKPAPEDEEPAEDDEEEEAPSGRRPVAQVDEEEEGGEEAAEAPESEEEEAPPPKKPSDKKKAAAAVVPKDEDGEGGEKVVAERDAPGSPSGAESKLLRFSLAGGSQLTSAYTVSVAAGPTQLAYKLNPLLLVQAGVALNVPTIPLGAELSIAFVPVKYQVDVQPAVDPNRPSGRFIDIGGLAFYRFVLSNFGAEEASRFWVAPLVGFEYASLSVQQQNPDSIVLSWAMTMPIVGARAGVELGPLVLEADARVRVVLGYTESPVTTGESGGGAGFVFNAGARYWTTSRFGVFGQASYLFSNIGLSGAGTRKKFSVDPALQDAKIANSELRLAAGVLLAI